MANTKNVKGVDQVLSNIDKVKAQFGSGFKKGLTRAALHLQSASQKLTPVDTGNLRASAFTRVTGSGMAAKATVGYTAFYALFVHELVEMKLKGQPRPGGRGHFWDPQGKAQAKFLETPMRTEKDKLRQLIRDGINGESKSFKAK